MTGWSGRGLLAAILTLVLPLFFLLHGREHGAASFWVLYGSSNQLLAAFSLMAVSVWLKRSGRPNSYAWPPMIFLLLVSASALGLRVFFTFRAAIRGRMDLTGLVDGSVSVVLLALAGTIALQAWRAVQ